MSGALKSRQRKPRPAARPAPPAPERVLLVEVTYEQLPDLLADRFRVHSEIDPKFGALIRSNAGLYAVRAIVQRLEDHGLLGPADAELRSLSPDEQTRL